MPPPPSLIARLSDFRADLARLVAWRDRLLAGRLWAERLNELRFVRATLAWEDYLEETFLCFLRGARSLSGATYAVRVPPPKNMLDARTAAIGSAPFGSWLNESWTQRRAQSLFGARNPYMSLGAARFTEIRVVRNRIVHRSESSKREFQNLVVSTYGAARPGWTPGRLLSDSVGGRPTVETYLNFLDTAARAIAS